MEDTRITFETAKLAKEKGFDVDCLNFYTNPNSKMFGLDEQNRPYNIKNIPKKIYTVGKEATLNIKNVILAPTQSLLAKWLREKHNIHIDVYPNASGWQVNLDKTNGTHIKVVEEFNFQNKYEEAFESGLQEALKLIKSYEKTI